MLNPALPYKLTDDIKDIIFRMDDHWRLTFLNAAWEKMTGFKIESSLGKSLLSFLAVSPANQQEHTASLMLKNQLRFVSLQHADNAVGTYEIAVYPEASGQMFAGVLSQHPKLSYHVDSLPENGQFLMSMINNFSDAIHSIDHQYKIIFANKAFLQEAGEVWKQPVILGETRIFDLIDYPQVVPVGNTFSTLEKKLYWKSVYDNALRGKSFKIAGYVDVHRNRKYVDLLFFPVIDPTQKITGCSVVSREVAESSFWQRQVGLQTTILKNVKDGIVVTDAEGSITYFNDGAITMFGYPPEEMQGKALRKLFKEAYYANLQDVSGEILPGQSVQFEAIARRKNGQQVWVDVSCSSLQGEGSQPIGILNMIRDISQRKQAELKLRESEELKSAIIHALPDLLFIVDRKGVYLEAYAKDERELARPKEELIGKTIYEVLPPDVAEGFYQILSKSIETNKVYTLEYQLFLDQTTHWFEARTIKGGENHAIILVRNITEEVIVHQKIKESEAKLREAQKIAKIGSYEFDLQKKEITWSDEMYRIMGVEPSFQVDENSLINLIHPEDKERVIKNFYNYVERESDLQGDYRIIRPDGKTIHVLGINQIVIDDERNPIKAIGIIQDITERKNAEKKIEAQNRELRKLNHELDNLIYSSSHDLRSPLSSALGLLSIIRLEKEAGKKEEYLQLMEKSLKRLDRFTRDILDLYKNTRTAPEIEAVNFQKIVEEILDEHQFVEGSAQIRKMVAIEQTNSFYSESKRLKIIFSNLVSNAIRYHKLSQPDPFLKVSGKITRKRAVLQVVDNGQGIQKEHINKIFNMFYRAHPEKKGSGLGLYLVKETVEKLGGTIRINSTWGKGTTFTVTLPDLKAMKPAAGNMQASEQE